LRARSSFVSSTERIENETVDAASSSGRDGEETRRHSSTLARRHARTLARAATMSLKTLYETHRAGQEQVKRDLGACATRRSSTTPW